MTEEHHNKRYIEDWRPIKLLREGWPVILAVLSIVSMYTTLSNRVDALERISNSRTPVVDGIVIRVNTIETKWSYIERRLDGLETKIDRIYQKVK